MSALLPPAPRPCESCPYRTDVPSGVWSEEEYDKLIEFDRNQWAGVFQCHQTDRDSDKARMCAGWTYVHGPRSIWLRMAVSNGTYPREIFAYETDVELFEDGLEAAEWGMEEIDDPGPQARRMIEKISANRSDVHT